MDALRIFADAIRARDPMQRANTQVMDDYGTGQVPMVGFDDADANRRIPTMFPEDREAKEIEQVEYQSSSIGGINYECPVCKVGDGDPHSVNDMIKKMLRLDRQNFMRTSDRKVNTMMAKTFNEIVQIMREAGDPDGMAIPFINHAHMKYHRTRCDRRNLLKMSFNEIEMCNMVQDFIRYNGLLVEFQDEQKIDNAYLSKMIKLSDLKRKWMREVKMLEKEEEEKYQKESASTPKAGVSKDFTKINPL